MFTARFVRPLMLWLKTMKMNVQNVNGKIEKTVNG
jgi:hypothetical protein